MSSKLSYIICASPRTGSTLLAEMLQDTKLAGAPREWFNPHEVENGLKIWQIEHPTKVGFEPYIKKLLERKTGPNGVFGIKIIYNPNLTWFNKCMQVVDKYRGVPVQTVINEFFPNLHYIRIKRRDAVRQAISYARAEQTQEWWIIEGANKQQSAITPTYNLESIIMHHKVILEHEVGWNAFLAKANISPIVIYYEDFIENKEQTVKDVLQYLGVDASHIKIPPPRLKKQSDAITEEWVEKYQDYLRGKAKT